MARGGAYSPRNNVRDSETGVCIMKMDAGLDTGPVVKESTPIKADDTTSFLSERLADLGAKLLIETIKKIDELIPNPVNYRSFLCQKN